MKMHETFYRIVNAGKTINKDKTNKKYKNLIYFVLSFKFKNYFYYVRYFISDKNCK
jgi:hypothetical protein